MLTTTQYISPDILLWLLTPATALVLGRMVFVTVRWLRADTETRISLGQARRIRRTWKRLAPMAELAAKDATPTGLEHLSTDGKAPRPKIRIPRITTKADEFGVTVTATTLPRVGLEAWQDAADDLRNGWGMTRVKITQSKPGQIAARGFRREPLDTLMPSPLFQADGSLAVGPGSLTTADDVLFGWDEDGQRIRLNLAKSAHGLIAGVTRSGKSITVNTLLAYASLMRDVQLIVIDPNLAAAAPWWRTAHKVSASVHPDEASDVLAWVREEMNRREKLFWSARTDRITAFSEELPLLVVVIDEVANYTRYSDRKARERFEAQLLAIASQGAKFGVRLWLITQKPSADVLSTAMRTNLSARICHRVDTVEDFLHLFPDGRELEVNAADREMPQGVSIASIGDMRTPVRMRSVYLPTESCWQISEAMCHAGLQVRDLPTGTEFVKVA
ncbi:FtsK/SpoIIIE domain-containing protein [Streptomyces sp. SP17BM10]|uniref:FtsK/SpoIIIE domain-containing protein n=1 Tax=Streptomyces sp. SP17BM10 TaxID=3002530 RepID=UPI002E79DDB4|nr:FtsK/SpoIIIE domain-containing protein [Streptomyces sp. SP17BM10]MEE1782763.1 FtsK/SpoIIIE domain-containing protein [Streptomyces sp. SP17BM10]